MVSGSGRAFLGGVAVTDRDGMIFQCLKSLGSRSSPGLCRGSARVSLGPAVRVNAVAPGLVDTPMTAEWTEAQRLWREDAPMGRAAQPDDVADIVSALVANTYITGEVILLDGGLNLR